ncbi:hypothetical protein TcCL_NonESM10678 [Trypanosoma cruzi]|nr:hypothetical protein TcCL_NonESM10678 [Trypanosoma cruzi]
MPDESALALQSLKASNSLFATGLRSSKASASRVVCYRKCQQHQQAKHGQSNSASSSDNRNSSATHLLQTPLAAERPRRSTEDSATHAVGIPPSLRAGRWIIWGYPLTRQRRSRRKNGNGPRTAIGILTNNRRNI